MRKTELALILAGGRGKRMDILCSLRPKPLLPFAGKFRVIDFTIGNCLQSRISDIALLVDYRRESMAEYLNRWRSANKGAAGLRILPPKDGSYAGTADAVYQNIDYLAKHYGDTVLVLAGDHVYRMDYRRMIDFHRLVQADVTVGVVRVPFEETHRFGTVTVNSIDRIQEFKEKASASQSNLASMGIYVFNKDLLIRTLREDALEPNSLHDFGYNILPRMVLAGRVFAFEFKNYWHDIGTVGSYYEANMDLLKPRPRLALGTDWPVLGGGNSLPVFAENGTGSVVNSLLGPGCIVKGRVENSVLSPGVQVAEQAVVRNSVVMAGAFIGYHSVIDGCIVDENVNVGNFCYVGFGAGLSSRESEITILGKDVVVPDRTAIGRQCNVSPGLGPGAFGTRLIPSGTTLVNT